MKRQNIFILKFLEENLAVPQKSITFAPAKRKTYCDGGVAQLVRASDS